ncbi:Ger(x)C family spore germination protein [Papillibacter cinnamivorans]|uniref:Spore germination protein KC n=1 Tax=Papillibacter cinnamivorans DSM 12816 TaxID=1122930 RepID=A0A1W1YER7_9FIRM|nr:Ger(x)C family spore germination protein [Papillibacter cinnamivorans]SMC34633.1 spore germination protein KC [Papillibacter cinnamivorans DSM 12816]
MKKRLFLFSLILQLLFLSGCWDYKELDDESIVTGMAIDYMDGYYHVTFDIADTQSAGKDKTTKSKFIESDGKTVFDAVRNAINQYDRRLYFGDCSILVISKTVAESGIAPATDLMTRDAEARITTLPIISDQETAKAIIMQQGASNEISSYKIKNSLSAESRILSRVPMVTLYQANGMIASDGVSLALPLITLNEQQCAQLNGMAIFHKDKMIGTMRIEDSSTFMYIKNKVKTGLFLVSVNSENPNITLEIYQNSTKITPVIEQDRVTIKIETETTCALAENLSDVYYDTPEKWAELANTASGQLEHSIGELVRDVQKNNEGDIFGFGSEINAKYPDDWDRIKGDWDARFKDVTVEVHSQFKIINSALDKSRVKVGE